MYFSSKKQKTFLISIARTEENSITGISSILSRYWGARKQTRLSAVIRWQLQQGAATVHSFTRIPTSRDFPLPPFPTLAACSIAESSAGGNREAAALLYRKARGATEIRLLCAEHAAAPHKTCASTPALQSLVTFIENFRVIFSHLKT